MMESKKPKILIIENSIGWTGAFKSIFFVSKSLSWNFEFHYAIPKKSSNEIYLNKYFENIIKIGFVEINRSTNLILYIPLLLWNTLIIHRYCKLNNIKIIHVNDLYNLTGIFLKFLKPSYKLIYHVRLLQIGFPKLLYRFWSKSISRFADEIIAVSAAVKKDFQKWSIRNIHVIYDTIPLEEKIQITNNGKDEICFLCIANFTKGKGQDHAIHAFKKASEIIPSIRMKFMGYDFKKKKNKLYIMSLHDLVNKYHLQSHIEFLEPTNEIEKVMKESDIILNFSEAESFSMVCYEALTYGIPLISTDCGGPKEFIEHSISGWLVKNKDIESMTQAMILLASDRNLRNQLALNEKKYISDFVIKNNAIQRYNNLYANLLLKN